MATDENHRLKSIDLNRVTARGIRVVVPVVAAVLLSGCAAGLSNDIYVTVFPLHGSESDSTIQLFLNDGNVNGLYQNPSVNPGYLDGPDLSVFHWDDVQSGDCAVDVDECATISTSDGFRNWNGPTRPHWGNTLEKQRVATVYYRLRDMARNYFDTHNQIPIAMREMENDDELVVMVERPDSVSLTSGYETICSGSCMRPWRSNSDKKPRFQIFRTVRPDGRNGGVPYNTRPKIFLSQSKSGGRTAKVQTHEFGHYYNRVFVEKYGLGGGFNRQGLCEEKALDEGLGYWYASDYASLFMPGRSDDWISAIPRYNDFSDPCTSGIGYDVHHLGDVITSAFWQVRQLPGIDVVGWRETVLALVDTTLPEDFEPDDPFGGDSIIRGFAQRASDQAASSGVFSGSAERETCEIYVDHQLRPSFLDQTASEATNEIQDRFGYAVASGDFNGDGRDDLAVGVPFENTSLAGDAGRVDVFYGTDNGLICGGGAFERLTQESGGSTSEPGDRFGSSLAAGDFNGDGRDDLAVGIPFEDQESATDSGFLHVYFGSSTGLLPANVERINQESGGSTSEPGDRFGFSLAAGDFNGDGRDDLAVGMPFEDQESATDSGFLHVYFGSSAGLLPANVERINQESGGSTSEPGDRFGFSLAAGDFNGDGRDDLAVGMPFEDQESASDSGFLHIYFGSSAGLLPANVDRVNQNEEGGTSESGDRFGWALASGDFDGDGNDDLAISALNKDVGATDTGVVYVKASF